METQKISIPQVLTHDEIQPQSFSDRRCLFTLPMDFLSSDIKICNLGLYDENVTGASGLYYPFGVGTAAAILNITLRCNGETIDRVDNLIELLTREYLRTSNAKSEDINRFDILNNVNIGINTLTNAMSYNDFRTDYFHTYGKSTDDDDYLPGGLAWQVNREKDDGNELSGLLNLRDIFPFLKATPVLPPMKNFSIEIEWNISPDNLVQDPRVLAAGDHDITNVKPKPLRPFVVINKVHGGDLSAEPMEIAYSSVIREQFSLPATGGSTQSQVFTSRSVKNKYVTDICLLTQVKGLTTVPFPFNKQNLCAVQQNERLRLTVNNNSGYLPLNGIDTPSLKSYYFNQAYGLLNVNYGTLAGVDNTGDYYYDEHDPYTTNINGGYSPFGVALNQVIHDLDIHYQRDGGSGEKQENPINLILLSTIAKKLLYSNGSVKILS